MIIEIPDTIVDALVEAIAERLAPRLERIAGEQRSPWMDVDEAIAYSAVPDGTFRRMVTTGQIRHHGGRTHRFHRDELDEDLGHARVTGQRLRSA